MLVSQESKYDCVGGKLINRKTREPIPDGEPVFILRAKDRKASAALFYYMNLCENGAHVNLIRQRLSAFRDFEFHHRDKMGEPDTALIVNPLETGFEDSETSL